jgi:4-azaleucine resistance transporter AzlC
MLSAQPDMRSGGERSDARSSGAGARAVLPLAAAIAMLGVSFGALATAAGLTPVAATVMSATTFAGSAQFAAVSILSAGGTAATAVATAGLLNARYAATGFAVAPALRGSLWRRFFVAQLAVDESWGVAYLGDGRFSEQRLVGAGLVLFAAHVGSTAIGAFAGDLVGDPRAWGLDAAFPALFLVLLSPHLRRPDGRAAAALGAAIALATTPFVPAGITTLIAAAASLLGLRSR